jgi:hypothetical protein
MEPFDDPVIGRMEWDATCNEWRGELVTTSGNKISISVDCDREAVPTSTRESFAWLCDNERALRDQLAGQMLESANDWRLGREPLEPEITAESFADRIELCDASLGNDGAIFLTYSDGEMFGSHAIVVNVSADRVLGDANLWG